ncbi:MAG: DUF5104 domain-containing protein [Oscillospiraceae bacterium]|nr:DUF5104 domain-containing protein [Oscillospiraceae bacterium]
MIDEQIQKAFEFIDGEIISYELPTSTGGGGRVVEEGKLMSENISPQIKNIETDIGKIYRISFQYFLTFEYDEDVVGVRFIHISIINENNLSLESLTIGYSP